MIAFFIWFLGMASSTILPDFGYEQLTPAKVQVSPVGEIFVLDSTDAQIVKYDARGNLVLRISRKGRGPDELLYPASFYLRGGLLYVSDLFTQSVKAFDTEGHLVKTWKNDFRKINMMKMAQGWLFLQEQRGSTNKVSLSTDELDWNKTVFTWKPQWVAPPNHHRRLPKVAHINPVREHTLFAVDSEGRFAFIGHTGSRFKVTVIDGVMRTATTIERDFPKVPFNKEWGLRTIVENQRSGQKQALKMKLKAPDYFPMLRSLMVTPDGHVVVRRWLGDPEQPVGYQSFNNRGETVVLPYDPANLPRILGIRGGRAFVSGFNREADCATILITSVDEVDRVVRNNPVPEDPVKPMWISLK